MEKNDEIKNMFIKKFHNFGGNYKKLDEAKDLKKKIDKLLQDIGTGDQQLLDTSRLLEIHIEEGLYDEDFKKFCEKASPIVDRLKCTDISNWDINDMRIAQATINYTKSSEETDKLEKKTIAALKMHIKDRPTHVFEFLLYLNVQVRYLKTAYYEEDITQESTSSKKLKKRFKDCSDHLLKIYESNKEEFKAYKYEILTRIALFNRDSNEATKNLELLRKAGDKALYNSVRKEVVKHSPQFGSDITDHQFSIMIGAHIRELRQKAGISVEGFAAKLYFSKNYINLVETGKRNFTARTLARVGEILNVTVDEIIHGAEGKKKKEK